MRLITLSSTDLIYLKQLFDKADTRRTNWVRLDALCNLLPFELSTLPASLLSYLQSICRHHHRNHEQRQDGHHDTDNNANNRETENDNSHLKIRFQDLIFAVRLALTHKHEGERQQELQEQQYQLQQKRDGALPTEVNQNNKQGGGDDATGAVSQAVKPTVRRHKQCAGVLPGASASTTTTILVEEANGNNSAGLRLIEAAATTTTAVAAAERGDDDIIYAAVESPRRVSRPSPDQDKKMIIRGEQAELMVIPPPAQFQTGPQQIPPPYDFRAEKPERLAGLHEAHYLQPELWLDEKREEKIKKVENIGEIQGRRQKSQTQIEREPRERLTDFGIENARLESAEKRLDQPEDENEEYRNRSEICRQRSDLMGGESADLKTQCDHEQQSHRFCKTNNTRQLQHYNNSLQRFDQELKYCKSLICSLQNSKQQLEYRLKKLMLKQSRRNNSSEF